MGGRSNVIAGPPSNASAARRRDGASIRRTEALAVTGGVLGALAASSCCILPLALFSLGVSGAWIGNLTAIAPYQPYIIAATVVLLGYGYWLVDRSRRAACRDGEACGRAMANRTVLTGLVMATVLVLAAVGFNLLAPTLLGS